MPTVNSTVKVSEHMQTAAGGRACGNMTVNPAKAKARQCSTVVMSTKVNSGQKNMTVAYIHGLMGAGGKVASKMASKSDPGPANNTRVVEPTRGNTVGHHSMGKGHIGGRMVTGTRVAGTWDSAMDKAHGHGLMGAGGKVASKMASESDPGPAKSTRMMEPTRGNTVGHHSMGKGHIGGRMVTGTRVAGTWDSVMDKAHGGLHQDPGHEGSGTMANRLVITILVELSLAMVCRGLAKRRDPN